MHSASKPLFFRVGAEGKGGGGTKKAVVKIIGRAVN